MRLAHLPVPRPDAGARSCETLMLTFPRGRTLVDANCDASVADRGAIEALVLAGSHTWRTTAFDALLPRPLLPVAHVPLIGHALR